MKVYIVDDEPKIRRGLQTLIHESRPSWPLPLQAANGQEAWNDERLGDMDLLFLDIRMPCMDGLELLSLYRERYGSRAQVIIVSGYADFHYAQQGIKLGVSDYLLKPVDVSQLLKILDAAEAEQENRLRQSDAMKNVENSKMALRRSFFSSMVLGTMEEDPAALEEKLRLTGLDERLPYSLHILRKLPSSELHYQVDKRLATMLKKLADMYSENYVIGNGTSMLLVCLWRENTDEAARSEVRDGIRDIAKQNGFLTGESALYYHPDAFLKAYHEAETLLLAVDDPQTEPTLADDRTNYVAAIIEESGKYHPVVQKTIRYVVQRYDQPLRVEQIAAIVFVHANYLSDLFKSETGHNLSSFISDYRMCKAKESLARGEDKIYLLAEKLGYSNQQYFSQVFKKRVGMSPQAYRRLFFEDC